MRKIFILLALAFCEAVQAQDAPDLSSPWTLPQCIAYAQEHNISIKQSKLSQDLAEVNYLQSKLNVLPTLNGNASHSYNFGRTIDPFTNEFATDKVLSQNFSLSSGFLLFNGFQNYNTIQEQKFNMLAAKQDLEKMKNDISLGIANAYLQILFAEDLVFNAQGQLSITKLQVERTKKLVEAGSISKSMQFDIEAQSATEELNLVNAENQLTMAYLNLTHKK